MHFSLVWKWVAAIYVSPVALIYFPSHNYTAFCSYRAQSIILWHQQNQPETVQKLSATQRCPEMHVNNTENIAKKKNWHTHFHPMFIYVFTIWTYLPFEATDKMTKLPECEWFLFSCSLSLSLSFSLAVVASIWILVIAQALIHLFCARISLWSWALFLPHAWNRKKSESNDKKSAIACQRATVHSLMGNSPSILSKRNVNSTHMSHYTHCIHVARCM